MIKLKLLLFVMCAGVAAGAQEKMTPQNIRPSRQRFTPEEMEWRNSETRKFTLFAYLNIRNEQLWGSYTETTITHEPFVYDYLHFHNPVPVVKKVNIQPECHYSSSSF